MTNEDRGLLSLRAKNLLWTVSGDRTLKIDIDESALGGNRDRCLYEALKLGMAEKLFGLEGVMLYSLKKGYCGADTALVQELISLCIDAAVYSRAQQERAGASELRAAAYEAQLDEEFAHVAFTPIGKLSYAHMAQALGLSQAVTSMTRPYFELLESLDGKNSEELIAAADRIYNEYVDPAFGKRNITLEQVLAVSIQEMIDEGYLDALDKSAYIGDMLSYAAEDNKEEDGPQTISTEASEMDPEQLRRMELYTDQVFGKNALTQQQSIDLIQNCCKGLHDGRRVHMTKGLLADGPVNNIHYKLAEKHRHHNEMAYYSDHRVVKQNIRKLTDILKRSLIRRAEPDYVRAPFGRIQPEKLWQIGRLDSPDLFKRRLESDPAAFVVDVLMDGSGSQSRRQGLVASQAYILAAALSGAGIPHRVMSYCTSFDCTVLQRFRDFDDPPQADWRIFQYAAKAANRDGLAIRAAVTGLEQRREQVRILILLSDGKPNDVSIQSGRAAMQKVYTGDTAVNDAAYEVRRAREKGIAVLGVFAGFEQDLQAERRIFGKDFAYIRSIANFSQIVGKYLQKCLDEE